ncbi:MAG: Sec-independent protein translocase protein TatB [Burkholderiales bacterium]
MFDIGFSELMVVGVVALVVIGPERLPKVARTAGLLMGRMQRYVAGVKADINREMEDFDQIKDLKDLRKEVESAGSEIEAGMRQNMQDAQQEVQSISRQVGANMATGASGINALGQASIAAAASDHAANQISVSVPHAVEAAQSERSPQLELALDSPDPAKDNTPSQAASGSV